MQQQPQEQEKEMWSKQDILDEIARIQTAMKEKYSVRLRLKNPELLYKDITRRFDRFHDRYPEMMRKIVTEGDGFNMEKLEMWLSMYERVRLGEVTNEVMSARVGQMAYDEYVKPIVNKMPPSSSQK